VLGGGAEQALGDLLEAAGVPHRRADAVEPGALVGGLRRGERRAGNLLGVKPVVHLLRRIPADRQRTRQGFGFEAVAESGHVLRCHNTSPEFLSTMVLTQQTPSSTAIN
jgi:hypothetical protein